MTEAEKRIVRDAQSIVSQHPSVGHPTIEFKRDWAYGNAGIEDARITREQVERTIKE
ncbi:MAG TPA: hypothetical protein VGD60_05265 [Candidatus Acidoferrales bacterium]